ncbi:hypothetical protein PENNAL_c0022G04522 [Penicillium nalgiovense]|uniref:Uncharacterized protein n=1 Tax=Penicillium nalgiovense TaxID=60175 RepID=A0A1V6YF83_PENNA|nr:hypothetical protein PENNAL_c0022G04522 [Penicillium nalgiovense]
MAGLPTLPPYLAGRPSREDLALTWETAASLGFDNNQMTGDMVVLSKKETVIYRPNAQPKSLVCR